MFTAYWHVFSSRSARSEGVLVLDRTCCGRGTVKLPLQGSTAVQTTVSDCSVLSMLGSLQAEDSGFATCCDVLSAMRGIVEHILLQRAAVQPDPQNPKTRLKHMPLVGAHLANSAVHKFRSLGPDAVFSEIWATLAALVPSACSFSATWPSSVTL